MSQTGDTLNRIFSIYNLLLIVCAFILNPFILYICLKSKKLRSSSTFKLLAFGAVNDLLTCLGWNQECFVNAFWDLHLYYKNLFYCEWISVFLQYTTLEIESWLLVSISLDRFLSLSIKKWSKHYFTGNRPFIYAAVLALLIIALNFNEVFLSGYIITEDGVEMVMCYETPPGNSIDWYRIMTQKNVYFGFMTPYGLLIILNSLIIYKATRFERVRVETNELRSAKRKAEMTRTIVFITFLYIVVTLPSTIVTGYYFLVILLSENGTLYITIIDAIQFSYPALNFLILYSSNKLFAEEVKAFFGKMRRGSLTTQTKTNNTNNSSLNHT